MGVSRRLQSDFRAMAVLAQRAPGKPYKMNKGEIAFILAWVQGFSLPHELFSAENSCSVLELTVCG